MLRIYLVCFFFFLTLFQQSIAQAILEADPFTASYFAESISTEDLKRHLNKLTSEAFAGRETGTPGLERAAQYLVDELQMMNVEKVPGMRDFWQEVIFTWVKWEKLAIDINGKNYHHLKDFLCLQNQNRNMPNLDVDDVLFMGYGIDDPRYSDYTKVKPAGKVIMILMGEPYRRDSTFRISGTHVPSAWSTDLELKLKAAADVKAKVILVVDPELNRRIDLHRNRVLAQTLHFAPPENVPFPNTIFISPAMAKEIINQRENSFIKNRNRIKNTGRGRPIHLPVVMKIQQHLSRNPVYSKNILGFIPGTDANLRNQTIVLSAHYDHLGVKGQSMYPGADDNGSGTSAILEIMQAIALAKKEGLGPKRNVMCIFFTGEEKGLLGSQYYSMHPTIPLNQTIANINVDMIGRVDGEHSKNPHYIYVIGSDRLSTELHEVNEATNRAFSHLNLDYTYNAKDDPNRFYYRSDHYHFAKHGIPSIFFFSGVHSDYHRPSDTVDKILFDKYEAVTTHIFHTAWEIANRNSPLKVDVHDVTEYNRQ